MVMALLMTGRKRELFAHHRELKSNDYNSLAVISIDDAAFGVCQHGTDIHSASWRLLFLANIWHLGNLVNRLVYVGIKGTGKIQASDICQPLFLLLALSHSSFGPDYAHDNHSSHIRRTSSSGMQSSSSISASSSSHSSSV